MSDKEREKEEEARAELEAELRMMVRALNICMHIFQERKMHLISLHFKHQDPCSREIYGWSGP